MSFINLISTIEENIFHYVCYHHKDLHISSIQQCYHLIHVQKNLSVRLNVQKIYQSGLMPKILIDLWRIWWFILFINHWSVSMEFIFSVGFTISFGKSPIVSFHHMLFILSYIWNIRFSKLYNGLFWLLVGFLIHSFLATISIVAKLHHDYLVLNVFVG